MAAITPEQRQQMSERMKVRWAAMSPDERAAYRAKFQEKDKSARARKQLLEFWANCTGEARAKKCAHLTNPEAQAKSHAAQRTPEFVAKKSAWAKAALARKTPEERRAAIEKQKETKRRKREERIARGEIVPAERKPKTRMNRSSPEYRAHQSEALKRYWAKWREPHPKPRQFLTYQGVTLSQCVWAKKLGIRQTTISARMQKGLPVEMVLTTGRVPRSRPLT